MASGDPVHVNANTGTNGQLDNYNFGIGDDPHNVVNMQSPGLMNPANINPYAASYLNNLKDVASQYNDAIAKNYLNNDYYNKMVAETGQRAQTQVDNNFARMGMGGSSAAMGAGMEAQRQNQMAWDKQRLSDMTTAAGTMGRLNQMGYQGVMGIQGQYGQFQNSMADAYINMLNAQQGQSNSENQLYGSMIGGGMQAGGYAAGAAMMA